MKTKTKTVIGFAVSCAAIFASSDAAFASSCVGNCSTSNSPDGAVGFAPDGSTSFSWVSTTNGVDGAAQAALGGTLTPAQISAINPTDGSVFTTDSFTATAGEQLKFNFDYITSDGSSTYPDFAFAQLVNSSGATVALLFTAQTEPTGSAVPAQGLSAPAATLNPSSVLINTGPGSTVFSPLGVYSGECFDGYGNGCGNSGWVASTYNIASGGTYQLEFGVANAADELYDDALAFEGAEIGGTSIGGGGGSGTSTAAPEIDPGSAASAMTLLLAGLAIVRGRKRA